MFSHPEMPKDSEKGILKGMYKIKEFAKYKNKIKLLGSGTILREMIDVLQKCFKKIIKLIVKFGALLVLMN